MAGIWQELGIDKFNTVKDISVFPKYLNPAPLSDGVANLDLCKQCGGLCCKALGCHFHPKDFKVITEESMIDFINESGCISLDWFEGDPYATEEDNDKDTIGFVELMMSTISNERIYFPRMKSINAPVLDVSLHGQCAILTDKGCPLLFSYRPYGGRCLVPGNTLEDGCDSDYNKRECAKSWFPYKDIMQKVADSFAAEVKNMHLDPIMALAMSMDAELNSMKTAMEFLEKQKGGTGEV